MLPPERWRNLEIILMKLKLPPGEIMKSLITCSGKYADPLILESIVKILPHEDEEEMVRMYEGDEADLGKP